MNSVERAKNMATRHIEEAEATVRIRRAYTSIIVSNAQLLFPIFTNAQQKRNLLIALKDKDTDTSILYRGLLIQVNGVFENFVRSLCVAIVEKKCADAGSYNELDEQIRTEHIVRSAKILTYLKEGNVNGIKYNFNALQENLAECILNTNDYMVQPEVFTLLMGNCTSSRLTELFKSLSLSDPFDDELGKHTTLRRWAKDQSSRRVAKVVKSTLDEQIAIRNDIAHGNLTMSVSQTEFESSVNFFSAFIEALSEKVSTELKLV